VKLLVTGASGLIGSAIVRAAAQEHEVHEVTAMLRDTSDDRAVRGVDVPRVRADLSDTTSLRRAVHGVDTVIHCAAIYAYAGASADDIEHAAVDGTRNLLTAAADAGVRRVVVTTSSITCGSSAEPVAVDESHAPGEEYQPPYYLAKVAQERLAFELGAKLGLEVVVACPTLVVGGPDWRLVPSNAVLVRYLLDWTRSTFPGGGNLLAVDDAARGHLVLAEHGEPGRRYLLGGENVEWRALHRLISQLCGIGGPYLAATHTSAYLGAGVTELLAKVTGRAAVSTREEARTLGRFYFYDDAAARALGHTSRPVRDTVAQALGWLVTSPHVPAWARGPLRLRTEVSESRRLVPRPL
jgi:dihydroflavonol-4-reductase